MTIEKAQRDKVEIAYETFGGPPGDPLLLMTGVGAQMIYWHDEFCAALVERRFWMVRFDNRDAGLSTHLSSAGVPNQLRMLRRPAEAAVYSLEDMASPRSYGVPGSPACNGFRARDRASPAQAAFVRRAPRT